MQVKHTKNSIYVSYTINILEYQNKDYISRKFEMLPQIESICCDKIRLLNLFSNFICS
jgi:hypothetical protein